MRCSALMIAASLAACGGTHGPTSGSADAAALGQPPFTLTADITAITLLIPAARVLPYVPSAYTLATVPSLAGEMTSLYILASNFAPGPGYSGYHELGYMVAVTGDDGQAGTFFLRLQLDSQLAVDIGVQIYGYPKVLADVTYADASGTLTVTAERDGEPLLSAVATTTGPAVPYATPPFFGKEGFFVRRGMLVHAPSVLDVTEATPRALTTLDAPYLVAAGILTDDELPTLLAGATAFTMPHATYTLGVPVVDGPLPTPVMNLP